MIRRIVAMLGVMLLSGAAQAGPATADLSRCLVANSTPDDRIVLVRWMFVAASEHPAVASIAKVTEKDKEESNKAIATLFVSLLTGSCAEKAKTAFAADGIEGAMSSFEAFGELAGTELFAHPEVAKSMARLEKYIDGSKLEPLMK